MSDAWGAPSAPKEFEKMMQELARRAWANSAPSATRSFLFNTDLLLFRDEEVLSDALHELYRHARRFAPGLDIPYHVPPVRMDRKIEQAGRYVNDDGWTAMDISPKYSSTPKAMWVILAHEACHHILDQSGLADKLDTARDERLTDAAMFICGFGELAKRGQTFTQRDGSGYIQTHLGYLKPAEYSFAYHWTIAARSANRLPGMEAVVPAYPELAREFQVLSRSDTLLQRLKHRVPDKSARERLVQQYRSKFPLDSIDEIYSRILESYERDSR